MAFNLAQKFVSLGMAPSLAVEYANQLNSGVYNWRRLMWAGMIPSLAKYVADSKTAGTFNPRVAVENTMSEAVAALSTGGVVPSAYLMQGGMSFGSIGDSLIGQNANCKGMSNFTALLIYYLKGLLRLTNASDQGIGGNRMDQMLARIDYSTAQNFDVVGFGGGRNDLSAGDTLATLQSEHSAIVSALWAQKASTLVLRWALLPATSDSGANIGIRDDFNTWLAAQENLTGSNRMIFFPVPGTFNPATHTFDGTHLNKAGAKLYVDSIIAKLTTLAAIDPAFNVFAETGAATYHGANLDTETALTGTSGTKTGTTTPTGNVASGKSVANATTAAVACSLSDNGDGTFTQIIDITGTVTTQGLVTFTEQSGSALTIGVAVGEDVEHFARADLTHTDGAAAPVGVLGWADVVGTLGQHFTTSITDTDTLAYPLTGGVLRTWPLGARAATASVSPTIGVLLAAGTVNVRLAIKLPRIRKTELATYGTTKYQGDNGIKTATEQTRITGTGISGTTITAATVATITLEPGTWSGGPLTFSRVMRNNGAVVSGAFASGWTYNATGALSAGTWEIDVVVNGVTRTISGAVV